MMISKFHRLIQSRLLWAAFLVVIVFSFVIWGIQFPGSRSARHASSPGRLYGKPVDAEEFRSAWQNEFVRMALTFGRPPPVDRRTDAYLTDRAWRRLISLREAQRMGLRVSDEEVLAYIRSIPVFQTNGRFDVQRYQAFVRQTLEPMGYPAHFLEEHIREELVLEKLRRAITAVALVPPTDVESALRRFTDRLTIEYILLPRTLVEESVHPSPEEIQAHFEANAERYRLPPRVTVRAVFFSAEPHLKNVPPIPEAEMEDYYEEHIAEFKAPVVTAIKEDETASPPMVTAPFEVVRSEIESRLRMQSARQRALEEADAFWRRISPLVSERPLSFDEAAQRAHLEILTFGPFAESEAVADFPAGSEFHRAAFELREGSSESFSMPIAASKGYYVISLVERVPAHMPVFDEVAEQVAKDTREKMVLEALDARARQIAGAVRSGVTLKELAETNGLTYETPPPFTFQEDRPPLPEIERLLESAIFTAAGEVLEPVRVGTDRVVVARLVERQPGSPEKIASLRNFVAETLRQQRAQQLFDLWQSDLLKRAQFEDISRRRADDDEDET